MRPKFIRCENCIYFELMAPVDGDGDCRYSPPSEPNGFVTVHKDDFCRHWDYIGPDSWAEHYEAHEL
jgi:hypothetical protein